MNIKSSAPRYSPTPMLIPITIEVRRIVSVRDGHVTFPSSFLTSMRNLNISDNFTTTEVQNAKSNIYMSFDNICATIYNQKIVFCIIGFRQI